MVIGMKKVLLGIMIFLLGFSLCSCKKETEPTKINNEETEQIDNLSEGTKERISYLHEKYSNNDNNSIFRYLDGFSLLYKSSSIAGDDALAIESTTDPNAEKGETSKTNIIVDGVDEADTIKNDNRYLYVSKSWYSNVLLVVDSNTNEYKEYDFNDANEISTNDEIKLYPYYWYYRNRIEGLYLNSEKLIVILQKGKDINVKIFDTKDPLSLEMINEYTFNNAYYSDSRMIDDELILIYDNVIFDDEAIIPITYKDNYKDITVDYNDIIILEETDANNNKYEYGTATNTISKIDLDNNDVKVKSFYGLNGYEYSVSKNNIYLIDYIYENEINYSEIYRIELDSLILKGKIRQDGTLNNLYSIDEYNGILRVATTLTSYNNKGTNYKNYLSTYDIKDDEFKRLDTINFAENERIYSATFNGDLGYIVTYLYIDPLFEFDLSDPNNIKILRQLKSPGVSDYLDYINEDLILGIGRITTEHNNGDYLYATSDGLKLSLFSLDNEEMKEESTKTFDYEYSYSSAQYDHKSVIKLEKSLMYFIPFFHYSNVKNSNQIGYETFDGILAFKVNENERDIEIIDELEADLNKMVVINGELFVVTYKDVLIVDINSKLNVIATIK